MRQLALIVLLLLTGCMQNLIPSIDVPSDLIKASLAAPVTLSETAFAASTPSPVLQDTVSREPTINTGPERKSVDVGTADAGGDAGTFFTEPIQGLYVNNTAYPTLVLNTPPAGQTFDTLYAPTTHLGASGCLEISTDYWASADGTMTRALRLYNFCNNVGWNTGVDLPIDSTFQEKYLRDLGYDLPQYTTEIVGDANNVWRLLIYNYQSQNWELLYTSQPATNNFDNGLSWSFFETHYSTGTCSVLPTIASTDMQTLNNGTWVDVNNEGFNSEQGNCFESPATNVLVTWNQNSWGVTSP